MVLQAEGRILLGGSFNSVGGTARNRFAWLFNDPANQTLSASDAAQVIWSRSGSSPEVSQVTVEQRTNAGITWTSLGSATRVGSTPNWQLTSLSLPISGQLRARGRTVGGNASGSSGQVESLASYNRDIDSDGLRDAWELTYWPTASGTSLWMI